MKGKECIFNALSWYGKDEEEVCDETNVVSLRYYIKIFGRTIDGSSVSVTVRNFPPYFYIKVDESWDVRVLERFKNYLKSKNERYSEIECKILHKKDLWGFTNFRKFKFVKLCFKSLRRMRDLARYLERTHTIKEISSKPIKFRIYESNIDPYIRFMHQANIDPCGWIKVQSYRKNTDIMETNCNIDISASWGSVKRYDGYQQVYAPFKIASFDIECTSSNGDFPKARKDYKKLAYQLYDLYHSFLKNNTSPQECKDILNNCILYAVGACNECQYGNKIEKITIKKNRKFNHVTLKNHLLNIDNEICCILDANAYKTVDQKNSTRDTIICKLNDKFDCMVTKQFLPEIEGDEIIQIGTTVHTYGSNSIEYKNIITLGSCNAIDGVDVQECATEAEVLLKWTYLIQKIDPDVIIGYNIFGFDMMYMYERAKELNIQSQFMCLGRFSESICNFETKRLSSSALGDNFLHYIDMEGRVLIDLYKVIQREHKLDEYKLNVVSQVFIGDQKNDILPKDIFRLQQQGPKERAIIAEYCIQDCALVNRLLMKLETMANNIGMSNVCAVPLSFIFMRGQGIKIFSLILKECKKEGYLAPVIRPPRPDLEEDEDDDSYEGAIVLEPKEGIYINDPVSVLDFASLYPNSMISHNLSQDCLVLEDKYKNVKGVDYLDITYDLYDKEKKKIGEKICRFAQPKNNEKGLIPKILQKLLAARKSTRKNITMKLIVIDGKEYRGFLKGNVMTLEDGTKIEIDDVSNCEDVYDKFQQVVLDGLQLAYKVTANSLYGQCGAKTSQIHMKDIAACTTAVGREMIIKLKTFLEHEFNANIIYGDTDSIFAVFPDTIMENSAAITGASKGKAKIMPSIKTAIEASRQFKSVLKEPHDAEYEKTFWPFIILSKKRYVGNLYEMDDVNFKQKSMGIVLKRRDNAQIVKYIYGGIIDIILNQQDVDASIQFLISALKELINGKRPIEELIITKSLRADYKDPDRIAHKVLAERMGERDPGNKPQSSDRIPYIYIETINSKKKTLQGDKIEHPSFVKEHNLSPNYEHYITNQIMKPILQLYAIMIDRFINQSFDALHKKIIDDCGDQKKAKDKLISAKEECVKNALFNPILIELENKKACCMNILEFFPEIGKVYS